MWIPRVLEVAGVDSDRVLYLMQNGIRVDVCSRQGSPLSLIDKAIVLGNVLGQETYYLNLWRET